MVDLGDCSIQLSSSPSFMSGRDDDHSAVGGNLKERVCVDPQLVEESLVEHNRETASNSR